MLTQTQSPVPPTPRLRDELLQHLPALRARALKLCLDASDASDLVQDTVERALRFESSYTPGTNLRAWLNQVLFSVFITGRRRARREKRALGSLTHDPCAWTHSEPARVLASLSRHTEQALSSLPPSFQAVVKLVDLDERSYKDAAELLEVPIGTVMSRLFRARRLLRESLEQQPAALQAA